MIFKELHKKALREANSRGYPMEAWDFAQWLCLEVLEGRRTRQRMNYSFIDYMRETYGDARVVAGFLRRNTAHLEDVK